MNHYMKEFCQTTGELLGSEQVRMICLLYTSDAADE